MTDSNQPIVIEYHAPSVKDQIVTASVGLGVSLAVSVAFIGGVTAVGAVRNKLADRKAKKIAKNPRI